MTRRDLLKRFGTMTAAALALPMVDVDQLVWVPRPIVTVPTMAAVEMFQFSFEMFVVDDRVRGDGPGHWELVDRHISMIGDTTQNAVQLALGDAALEAKRHHAERIGAWALTSRRIR